MQIEALAVRLRSRSKMEAADLGVGLCQRTAGDVYSCCAVALLPVALVAAGSFQIAEWLPTLLIWWAKPWLDRTILFVLSRAAFGQRTRPGDLWRSQRDVWWRQLLFTWSIRRLSLWRSFTQPMYQLEGGTLREAGARIRQIRRGHAVSALMITCAFSTAEASLTVALLSLVFWFAPSGTLSGDIFTGTLPRILTVSVPAAYAITVLFLEPFYVAAGFAMYLNRRAELEAWDIEQEFRRAFATASRAAILAGIVLALALTASARLAAQPDAADRPSEAEVARAIDRVKADPNLAIERTIKTLQWKATNAPSVDPQMPSWLLWFIGLFSWVDQSARFLMWVAVAGLAVMLCLYLVRLARTYGARTTAMAFVPPTHVRDLDIRPESLPNDVGSSARALWDRGEHRAALSLLYRGLLSRLVHIHRVPIRDSSTEGDCLSMSARHLTQQRQNYTLLLVHVWQRFVYGGESVDAATVYALCREFASILDRASPSAKTA